MQNHRFKVTQRWRARKRGPRIHYIIINWSSLFRNLSVIGPLADIHIPFSISVGYPPHPADSPIIFILKINSAPISLIEQTLRASARVLHKRNTGSYFYRSNGESLFLMWKINKCKIAWHRRWPSILDMFS